MPAKDGVSKYANKRTDFNKVSTMTLSVSFKSVNYYAGILMRHDHPLHDMILSYYQDFLKHVPQLYTPRGK